MLYCTKSESESELKPESDSEPDSEPEPEPDPDSEPDSDPESESSVNSWCYMFNCNDIICPYNQAEKCTDVHCHNAEH